MATTLTDNIILGAQKPLDARTLVSDSTALTTVSSPYIGMLVYIKSTGRTVVVKSTKGIPKKINTVALVATSNSSIWRDNKHPTTINGYGITDAYISGNTIKLGSSSINVGSTYTLPAATSNSLGGIKVGSTLEIDDGVLDFKDAPNDGHFYARCNNQWVDITDKLQKSYFIQVNTGLDQGKWYVDDISTSYSNGHIYTADHTGSYYISFKPVTGYTAPLPFTAIITQSDASTVKVYNKPYTQATTQYIYYGYYHPYKASGLTNVADIPATAILNASVNSLSLLDRLTGKTIVKTSDLNNIGHKSISILNTSTTVGRPGWLLAYVPLGYSVKAWDGWTTPGVLTGYNAFTDGDYTGSAANGSIVQIGGINYKVYGHILPCGDTGLKIYKD